MIETDYKDFGFLIAPAELLTQAVCEFGPLASQYMPVEDVLGKRFPTGYYKYLQGVTHSPLSGGKFAVYRWMPEKEFKR